MARLGTHKRPAVVRVDSVEKATAIVDLCKAHGWQVIAGVEPDEPEDTSDLEKLFNSEQRPEKPVKPRLPPRISGNDYCPCGSGKKFKACCGAETSGAAKQ